MSQYHSTLSQYAASFGEFATERSIDLSTAFELVAKLGAAEAESAWNATRDRIGLVADVNPIQKGLLVPGIVDNKAPIEILENSSAPAVAFTADTTLGTIKGFGADYALSIQRASKISPAGLLRTFKSLALHCASGPEDVLCDQLTALSLPAGQTDTTLMAGVGKYNLLRTTLGGMIPELSVVFASSSLRLRAANEFWGNAYPIVYSQFLPVGVAYLLPAPDSGVIVMPWMKGLSTNIRPEPGAAAGWKITVFGWAASTAPVLQSSFVVRVTLP